MKVEIKCNDVIEKTVKFPLIAESVTEREWLIVLFLSEQEGVVLKVEDLIDSVGQIVNHWGSCFDKDCWRILQEGEQLILSNTFE